MDYFWPAEILSGAIIVAGMIFICLLMKGVAVAWEGLFDGD